MTEKTEIQNHKNISLKDICFYNQGVQNDTFVGLRYENESLKINFPLGYAKPQNTEDENEYRKDILNLISVLTSYCDKDEFLCNESSFGNENNSFPIHAYIHIIQSFLQNGYYKETENIYKKSTSGKISWNRTIKQCHADFIEDQPIYLSFITKKTNYNQNELITLIHKFCVYESFSKIGYLFTSFMPEKSSLDFNASFFRSVILQRMTKTFNEKNQILFKNMIDIINFVDRAKDKSVMYYGTQNFYHVFETLVDKTFGEDDKEKFYPKVSWTIFNDNLQNGGKIIDYSNDSFKKNSLRPDTIMILNRGKENQKIFVLDSKYYKASVQENNYNLPGSDSVIKQIAYAEFIETKKIATSDRIFNAFILPYNADSIHNSNKMECFGFASTDYKKLNEKKYHKIIGIKIDTKELMYSHYKNDKKIKALAELIETSEKSISSR